jgi:hypothetical protein
MRLPFRWHIEHHHCDDDWGGYPSEGWLIWRHPKRRKPTPLPLPTPRDPREEDAERPPRYAVDGLLSATLAAYADQMMDSIFSTRPMVFDAKDVGLFERVEVQPRMWGMPLIVDPVTAILPPDGEFEIIWGDMVGIDLMSGKADKPLQTYAYSVGSQQNGWFLRHLSDA